MTLTKIYLALCLSIVILSLAACRESDVPPGNNADEVLDEQNTTATTGLAQNTQSNAAQTPGAAVAAQPVTEEDILPNEYLQDGAEQPDRVVYVTLQPTQGNTASGMVAFIQPDFNDDAVRIVGRITGIAAGAHGMHIHENGNCRTPDASSAGAHYDPTGTMQHGDRAANERHLGDLGNIDAGDDQMARFDFTDRQIALVGPNSIVTKALIVHAAADDASTQPSGNSGDPIACGVITPQENNLVPE